MLQSESQVTRMHKAWGKAVNINHRRFHDPSQQVLNEVKIETTNNVNTIEVWGEN